MALFINIEEHEEGFDYEFLEAEVCDITDFTIDENDDVCEFRVNNVEAYCPLVVFLDSWEMLETTDAWFAFRENLNPDMYNVIDANTGEIVETRRPQSMTHLGDIEYDMTSDKLIATLGDGTRVKIARTALRFVAY